MLPIALNQALLIPAAVFVIGVVGIIINRRSIISILFAIELMLLAVNLNMVIFSAHLGDYVGQLFAVVIIAIAAVEVAIGLAILVVYFNQRRNITINEMNTIKG